MESINLDYHDVAEKFIEITNQKQRNEARDKLNEYVLHIANMQPDYTAELIRLIQNDSELEEQLLTSVTQIACLITSTLIESIFNYDVVFNVVKRKTINDYDDVKLFKQYLLNTFNINEFEVELGYNFNDSTLRRHQNRYQEITEYFESY